MGVTTLGNVTLAQFMEDYNPVVIAAFKMQTADDYYELRGIEAYSLKITNWEPVEQATVLVLQQINEEIASRDHILEQETTNRTLNAARLNTQTEYQRERLKAEIALELQRTDLIKVTADNNVMEAEMAGEAEGKKYGRKEAVFVSSLKNS